MDNGTIRLGQVVKKLNVSSKTVIDFLVKKNYIVDNNPNIKLTDEQVKLLEFEFGSSSLEKFKAKDVILKHSDSKAKSERSVEKKQTDIPVLEGARTIGKIDLGNPSSKIEKHQKSKTTKPKRSKDDLKEILISEIDEKSEPISIQTTEEINIISESVIAQVEDQTHSKEEVVSDDNVVYMAERLQVNLDDIDTKKLDQEIEIVDNVEISFPQKKSVDKINFEASHKLQGLTKIGKMDLPLEKPKVAGKIFRAETRENRPKPNASTQSKSNFVKKTFDKKNSLNTSAPAVANTVSGSANSKLGDNKYKKAPSVPDTNVQERLRSTLAKISQSSSMASFNKTKIRKQKKIETEQKNLRRKDEEQAELKKIKISEFASANDIAILVEKPVTEVLSTCLSLGVIVSINQRLDAEVISIILEEFGFEAEFVDIQSDVDEYVDLDEDMLPRAPIVTIMGHVDHGKTSLLDYLHNLNITKKEAGGITQHIGAYDVTTKNGERIAFVDTPGHEAFTAMRARGAKITDIVVIVIAADDGVMLQTKEAISHAQAAGVPIVIAINKIDKSTANPEKIKEQLSQIGILVEEWGGKYQSQNISAKTGEGIDELLQKILLETEIIGLKANPNRPARGTVLESSIEKGRGYMSTVMIQKGTLKIGDIVLAGAYFGKVKGLRNHMGKPVKEAPPSTPVQIMGIEGAPQAGDVVKVMETEREARDLSTKRQQFLREQNMRLRRHISLDEVGRRIAIGNFQELKVLIRGDVDGSVEALSESLIKLSTEKIKLTVIFKSVGPISESDVMLASAADAIIIGFQVRPTVNAKQLAVKEGIDIRLYSVIYDAIDNIKSAMQGMLAPTIQENIVGTAAVLEVFKISKVGMIAGCLVSTGIIKRSNKIRVLRDGIVLHTGKVDQLKRFKDDAKEVKHGFECGISIHNFSNIKVGDILESFEDIEVVTKL